MPWVPQRSMDVLLTVIWPPSCTPHDPLEYSKAWGPLIIARGGQRYCAWVPAASPVESQGALSSPLLHRDPARILSVRTVGSQRSCAKYSRYNFVNLTFCIP